MDDLTLDGNPGWVDDDSADATLVLSAITHGGSVASITLDLFAHDGDPKVTVGTELTAEDCKRLGDQLLAIAQRTP